MVLIDEITQLRDDSLSSLNASHDYYVHTKGVWRLAQQMFQQGRKFTIRNQATGNTVDEVELSTLVQGYVTGSLASATFQHFVSLFERFVFDLLSLWLTKYPDSLSANQLEFQTVLEAPDKDAIVAAVVQKKVHGLSYKRVDEWFAYLENIAKLGCPNQDQIEQLAEIKASRDVLVHNNGIANAIYVDKANSIHVDNSKKRARFSDGDKLELPEQYHRDSWQLIRQVVTDVANAAINKLGN